MLFATTAPTACRWTKLHAFRPVLDEAEQRIPVEAKAETRRDQGEVEDRRRRSRAPSDAANHVLEPEARVVQLVTTLLQGDPRKLKIRIDDDDDETRALWETAKKAKAEVESWPAWKHNEVPRATPDAAASDASAKASEDSG